MLALNSLFDYQKYGRNKMIYLGNAFALSMVDENCVIEVNTLSEMRCWRS
ncbi:MAG: hypothetical protein IPG53_17025 [Ignavibacteriales bacterium]|nr:hypothetical protein [Ignavibacteriales bacterium]